MKTYRFLILFFFTILFFPCWSDTTIQMEEYGGVYRIPCTVNGAKMKFVFDTGASNVAISLPMAEYLYDNGFITENDILGTGQTVVADGRMVDHLIINLKDIQIGNKHIENVTSIVTANMNAPLLLGQSALKKLGDYSIEGNLLRISDSYENLDDMEFSDIAKQANEHSEFGRYGEAVRLYKYLYDNDGLTDMGIFSYAYNLHQNGNNESSIKIFKSLLSSDTFSHPKDKLTYDQWYNVPLRISDCYIDLGDYISAQFYVDKAIDFVNDYRLKQSISHNFANLLMDNEDFREASNYYWKAFVLECDLHNVLATTAFPFIIGQEGVPSVQLTAGMLDNAYWFILAKFYDKSWDAETCGDLIISIAHLGGESARRFCNENGINYK